MPVETLLLTAARVVTFIGPRALTNASGFFFEHDKRLFLVTTRHVMFDEESGHAPDRLEIELHTDAANLGVSIGYSVPLYRNGRALWRQGADSGGDVDIAVIELERSALPPSMANRAFTAVHLCGSHDNVAAGDSLLIVGFPLGFHDLTHHLPVVRHAVVASSFGLRFNGKGYFLTDARTHRGTSGAAVVARCVDGTRGDLPWILLGVHSARLDVDTRDVKLDERLGLNCAWYADMLLALMKDPL